MFTPLVNMNADCEGLNDDVKDEDDYYDEEYEDYYGPEDERPLAVDAFFNLPYGEHRTIGESLKGPEDDYRPLGVRIVEADYSGEPIDNYEDEL